MPTEIFKNFISEGYLILDLFTSKQILSIEKKHTDLRINLLRKLIEDKTKESNYLKLYKRSIDNWKKLESNNIK